MAWKKFPYPDASFQYTAASLKKNWHRLHMGDAEKFPEDDHLIAAWIAFHAGEFEQACKLGLKTGLHGYSVANKACCIHANYLETAKEKKIEVYQAVSQRCDEQQQKQPDNAAGYYWQAYALGRYSQEISIVKALAQGVAGKVRHGLDMTLKLEPKHADAHIALGLYSAEIIDKVGALIAGLTYDAKEKDSLAMFCKAVALNPESAIAKIEYGNGLVMLGGRAKMKEALALYRQAAACVPKDAMERLDVQLALDELES